ncbi:MAG: hypothetical protein K5668_11540 [Lachnospiraceae bacterium]|nr:hypothetical protein [Lachnospiraceae bacterium]
MNKRKVLSAFIFILIIAAITSVITYVMKDKKSWYYKSEFFNSRTDFDALYFGASRMHEAVDPIYMWEEHGISSYNMASAGESVQMSYYVLAEALEHCNPRVVFIDAAKISDSENDINSGYGFVHESIDSLPLNKNKWEAVNYAGSFFDGGKMAFLSMLYAYHGRYDDLKDEDFKNESNYDKGAYIMTSVFQREKPSVFTSEEKELKDGDGVRYYKRILDLCKEKGVLCVLTDIPVDASMYTEDRQRHLNAIISLTERSGGKSIAFNTMLDDTGLDYDHCFGDSGHLNFMGAEKVCDYLAEYMKTEAGVKDHRDDPAYSEYWNEDVAKWDKQRIETLDDRKDAVEYIFAAAGNDTDITLYVKNINKLYNEYAMDFCLEKCSIEPVPAEEDILGGYDMKVEVRRHSDGTFLSEQYFEYNDQSRLFTAE